MDYRPQASELPCFLAIILSNPSLTDDQTETQSWMELVHVVELNTR